MVYRGCCQRCQAPIFINRTTDWYGNTIVTLNCWNGHYKWIDFPDLQTDIVIDPQTNVVDHIGFFDLR